MQPGHARASACQKERDILSPYVYMTLERTEFFALVSGSARNALVRLISELKKSDWKAEKQQTAALCLCACAQRKQAFLTYAGQYCIYCMCTRGMAHHHSRCLFAEYYFTATADPRKRCRNPWLSVSVASIQLWPTTSGKKKMIVERNGKTQTPDISILYFGVCKVCFCTIESQN